MSDHFKTLQSKDLKKITFKDYQHPITLSLLKKQRIRDKDLEAEIFS